MLFLVYPPPVTQVFECCYRIRFRYISTNWPVRVDCLNHFYDNLCAIVNGRTSCNNGAPIPLQIHLSRLHATASLFVTVNSSPPNVKTTVYRRGYAMDGGPRATGRYRIHFKRTKDLEAFVPDYNLIHPIRTVRSTVHCRRDHRLTRVGTNCRHNGRCTRSHISDDRPTERNPPLTNRHPGQRSARECSRWKPAKTGHRSRQQPCKAYRCFRRCGRSFRSSSLPSGGR